MKEKPELAKLPEGPNHLYRWAATNLSKPPLRRMTVLHPEKGIMLDEASEEQYNAFMAGADPELKSGFIVATLTLEFH
jgi:hypothetical protein